MGLISIPAALRDYTGGESKITVSAANVAEALSDLSARHPRLRRHLYTERGDLRNYVNVFVNDAEIRQLRGVETPLNADDVLFIVPSIAGG